MTDDNSENQIPDGDVTELSGEDLVDQRKEIGRMLAEGDVPSYDLELNDRSWELWHEIRSRSDIDPPACPACGGRQWGQAPGDPVTCTDCGYETLSDLESRVHDAWETMEEDVRS